MVQNTQTRIDKSTAVEQCRCEREGQGVGDGSEDKLTFSMKTFTAK